MSDFPLPDPVYYRLYVDRNDTPVVVCMQSFDECDYDQKRFITDTRYAEEEQAESALLALKVRADMPLTTLERLRVAAAIEKEQERG